MDNAVIKQHRTNERKNRSDEGREEESTPIADRERRRNR